MKPQDIIEAIHATRNEGIGFFGAMNERAESAAANATGEPLDTVRAFLARLDNAWNTNAAERDQSLR